ncbi:proton-conducting transporter membrane subunit [Clostridium sp. MB40-C1]|uniref:complex I subunit 5 family protein n=1 Tax=Clostridium sp. MB40-C1 TaxID=3070996 RepID=UPI0027DEDB66|nr:proton-conducting transporter membrane subunit [Clostridium sp. MB40-C1]WMJ80193.1 proton-conducting transporter membrane subunit [Clostridium sp. MB40-C1]
MKSENLLLFIILFPMIGAFIGLGLGRINEKYRDVFNIVMTGIVFGVITFLYKFVQSGSIELSVPYIMGTGLHLKLDMFRYIFAWITSFVWFLVTIYSTQYFINYKNRNRYYFFFILTFASTIGLFVSENILNLFTFFEIMSLTSYPLIIHDESEYSHEAGNIYIVMAISGGLILLMGLFLLFDYTKTLDISQLNVAVSNIGNVKYVISALIIIGFGVKAGMFPLHIWMPKAHPAAPAPASAILSGILVKTGIFGIIIVANIMMAGDIVISAIILVIGFLNMFIGGFLAMFQRNIKRILAYSSMSQMGYILVGIGLVGMLKEHGAIAIYGSLYYVINHAIFKSLLFMIAGLIYIVLHELSINEIGGFGRNKNRLKVLFLIGMFSIIGMPGFNGYTGKTLLHVALSEAHHMYGGWWFTAAEIIFTISSAFTVAYLLKIFVAVFVEKNDPAIEQVKIKCKAIIYVPMVILSVVSIFIGIMPNKIFKLINKSIDVFPSQVYMEPHFYSASHMASAFLIILIGVGIYFLFIRTYLMKKQEEHWYYENYALNWISLEKNIYAPVGKVIFIVCSIILKIIDKGLIYSINTFNKLCKALTLREIKRGKGIKGQLKQWMETMIESSMACINTTQKNIKKLTNIDEKNVLKSNDISNKINTSTTNLRDEAYKLGEKMNSVTYSIFVFAGVLVACLLIMIV